MMREGSPPGGFGRLLREIIYLNADRRQSALVPAVSRRKQAARGRRVRRTGRGWPLRSLAFAVAMRCKRSLRLESPVRAPPAAEEQPMAMRRGIRLDNPLPRRADGAERQLWPISPCHAGQGRPQVATSQLAVESV